MLTFLAFLALASWIYLAFWRADYWRAAERLGDSPAPAAWPAVVAVIPARDEAASIAEAVAAHMASDYPGAFTLVIVDDASTDGTADIARRAGEGGARRLDIIAAPPLEPGWTGKLAAQRAGVDHARATAPDARYLLLCDADIVFAPDALRRLVAKAEAEGLALVSLMARLDARGFWGGLLAPAFVYFFQKLYPFPRVNDPESSVAAAAGGCMLARRDALEAAGGIDSIRTRLIDDCALAQRMKREGAGAPRPIWLGLAEDETRSLRDNRELSSFWSMVARTAFAQLGHSWPLLAGTVAGMTIIYLVPACAVLAFPFHHDGPAAGFGLAAWAIMAATYRPTAALYGQAGWRAALLPLAAFFYVLMTIFSAVQHERGEGGSWKGRTYP
ncbi:MAG: glycosyltransferase [Pseudomonadota bacterium]|nr:glycosyltransferase [Pseudomonadota bacterium]